MRVLMVSKALVVGAYQRKAEEIARLGIDLTVLIPPKWHDRRGQQHAERQHTEGYQLQIVPVRFNGSFHWHYYPTLSHVLDAVQPDILHMDEEPYNLATWMGLQAARRRGIPATFFTWQNLYRAYPPPFRWFEQANYRIAPIAIAGNRSAADVLRRKGYRGDVQIFPQFGVDPTIYHPAAPKRIPPNTPTQHSTTTNTSAAATAAPIIATGTHSPPRPMQIGYAGGLLPEKGVDLLVRACAELRGEWQLHLVGGGSETADLRKLATAMECAAQVTFHGRIESGQMPAFYRTLDVLVLPSRTTPSWKEQFGRVLIEAMASGVTVVGSSSGEIPHVLGLSGLIFPENSVEGLRVALQQLLNSPAERQRLAASGRQRVLDHYTMQHIARETVDVYTKLVS